MAGGDGGAGLPAQGVQRLFQPGRPLADVVDDGERHRLELPRSRAVELPQLV